MYRLTDKQIDHILDDISARGVKMESLQHNLLDHICCIIERDLEEDGDFERFYTATVQTFYKNELREIEEETINLLTFKNYYTMKKVMIISGAISAAAFMAGSIFKVMYWPGASALLLMASFILGFVFLPLFCLIKSKESTATLDKLTLGFGVLVGMLFCISVMVAVFHWPGGKFFWLSTICTSIFLFIPMFFYTGIRRPETKVNTILTSVILVGVTGLQFTLINIRSTDLMNNIKLYSFIQNDDLLKKMQQHVTPPTDAESARMVNEINNTCEKIKNLILENGGEQVTGRANMVVNGIPVIRENSVGSHFLDGGKGSQLIARLKSDVIAYNASVLNNEDKKIPIENTILEAEPDKVGFYSNLLVLNSITQLQMYLVNAESIK